MSSLAYPREATRISRRDVASACAGWGPDILLGVALTLLAAVLLAEVAGDVNVDSWLAVVAGRDVWQHGVPQRETLTVMAAGRPWIDQQWLSQLIDFAIERAGGFGLLAVVNVALLVGPVAWAVVTARRLGAPFRSALILLPVCLAAITPSREIRTQELAFPLFMAVVVLLVGDARRPSRRVLWCLPLLALWANLHGSVTLGAMLVVLRAMTLGWERRAQWRAAQTWARPLALLLGSALAILATPYGTSILGYYRTTMFTSTLRHVVVEWRPVTVVPTTAAAVFALLAVALWTLARSPGRTTLWDKLALLALAVGSISVIRNAVFFGMLSLVLLPVALGYRASSPPHATPTDPLLQRERLRAIINGTLAFVALLALAMTTLATLARPSGGLINAGQQPGLLATVERATTTEPRLRVLSDGHFADWLLWRDPALAGRVANDVRFELLSGPQVSGLLAVFSAHGPDWRRAAHGYRLLVLRRAGDAPAVSAFLREPGRQVLFDAHGQLVILRSAAEAARS